MDQIPSTRRQAVPIIASTRPPGEPTSRIKKGRPYSGPWSDLFKDSPSQADELMDEIFASGVKGCASSKLFSMAKIPKIPASSRPKNRQHPMADQPTSVFDDLMADIRPDPQKIESSRNRPTPGNSGAEEPKIRIKIRRNPAHSVGNGGTAEAPIDLVDEADAPSIREADGSVHQARLDLEAGHKDADAGGRMDWLSRVIPTNTKTDGVEEHFDSLLSSFDQLDSLVTHENSLTPEDILITALSILLPCDWKPVVIPLIQRETISSAEVISTLRDEVTRRKSTDLRDLSASKASTSSNNKNHCNSCDQDGHTLEQCHTRASILEKKKRDGPLNDPSSTQQSNQEGSSSKIQSKAIKTSAVILGHPSDSGDHKPTTDNSHPPHIKLPKSRNLIDEDSDEEMMSKPVRRKAVTQLRSKRRPQGDSSAPAQANLEVSSPRPIKTKTPAVILQSPLRLKGLYVTFQGKLFRLPLDEASVASHVAFSHECIRLTGTLAENFELNITSSQIHSIHVKRQEPRHPLFILHLVKDFAYPTAFTNHLKLWFTTSPYMKKDLIIFFELDTECADYSEDTSKAVISRLKEMSKDGLVPDWNNETGQLWIPLHLKWQWEMPDSDPTELSSADHEEDVSRWTWKPPATLSKNDTTISTRAAVSAPSQSHGLPVRISLDESADRSCSVETLKSSLKETARAPDNNMDPSGSAGVDANNGTVSANKDRRDSLIYPPIRKVPTTMPNKENQSTSEFGSGTLTQKKKAVSLCPVAPTDNQAGQDVALGPEGSEPVRAREINRSEITPANTTVTGFYPASRRRLFELALRDSDLDSVGGKRTAEEAEDSRLKRLRTSEPNAVANSIDRTAILEEERGDAFKLELAKLKLEKFPKREAAMKAFGKDARQFIQAKDLITAAKVLKSEDNASFFLLLDGQLKWDWLKEEAKLTSQEA